METWLSDGLRLNGEEFGWDGLPGVAHHILEEVVGRWLGRLGGGGRVGEGEGLGEPVEDAVDADGGVPVEVLVEEDGPVDAALAGEAGHGTYRLHFNRRLSMSSEQGGMGGAPVERGRPWNWGLCTSCSL